MMRRLRWHQCDHLTVFTIKYYSFSVYPLQRLTGSYTLVKVAAPLQTHQRKNHEMTFFRISSKLNQRNCCRWLKEQTTQKLKFSTLIAHPWLWVLNVLITAHVHAFSGYKEDFSLKMGVETTSFQMNHQSQGPWRLVALFFDHEWTCLPPKIDHIHNAKGQSLILWGHAQETGFVNMSFGASHYLTVVRVMSRWQ